MIHIFYISLILLVVSCVGQLKKIFTDYQKCTDDVIAKQKEYIGLLEKKNDQAIALADEYIGKYDQAKMALIELFAKAILWGTENWFKDDGDEEVEA